MPPVAQDSSPVEMLNLEREPQAEVEEAHRARRRNRRHDLADIRIRRVGHWIAERGVVQRF